MTIGFDRGSFAPERGKGMARFRAQDLSGVAATESGEVTFTFTDRQDDVLNLSVPEELLSQMYVQMAQCWKAIHSSRDGQPIVAYTETVDRTSVVRLNQQDLVAVFGLSHGMDVAYKIDEALASTLAEQIDDQLK